MTDIAVAAFAGLAGAGSPDSSATPKIIESVRSTRDQTGAGKAE
ncbi:hypothetical protein ACIPWF_18630 [Paenarthrobacter sp. NPDC089989]